MDKACGSATGLFICLHNNFLTMEHACIMRNGAYFVITKNQNNGNNYFEPQGKGL
jgi:hypothetical protein